VSARSEIAELVAVLVAVSWGEPRVLTARINPQWANLPCGPFQTAHRSLQAGLRSWVEPHIGNPLGYVEQLYTFADSDRANWQGQRVISVSYLGLAREQEIQAAHGVAWHDCYPYFPWEDWRAGEPACVAALRAALADWCTRASTSSQQAHRRARLDYLFPADLGDWNADLILQRYELLYEAGLAAEACRHRAHVPETTLPSGQAMLHDHRRILATGMARLRAKIRYHPVIFELLPPTFTLLQLQQTVEALTGQRLHKQNFRRLIAQQALVEDTGQMARGQAGRPAKLFQFRAQVLRERALTGSKLPIVR